MTHTFLPLLKSWGINSQVNLTHHSAQPQASTPQPVRQEEVLHHSTLDHKNWGTGETRDVSGWEGRQNRLQVRARTALSGATRATLPLSTAIGWACSLHGPLAQTSTAPVFWAPKKDQPRTLQQDPPGAQVPSRSFSVHFPGPVPARAPCNLCPSMPTSKTPPLQGP